MLCCQVVTRRSLTPSADAVPGLSPTRRHGGARREASDRLKFVVAGREIDGWALNISRGGLRAIVDEAIELGAETLVTIADGEPRPARIVWIQEEPDGAIVGVEFLDLDGPASVPPQNVPPPSEPVTPV